VDWLVGLEGKRGRDRDVLLPGQLLQMLPGEADGLCTGEALILSVEEACNFTAHVIEKVSIYLDPWRFD
jgi:hypothetical protein